MRSRAIIGNKKLNFQNVEAFYQSFQAIKSNNNKNDQTSFSDA